MGFDSVSAKPKDDTKDSGKSGDKKEQNKDSSKKQKDVETGKRDKSENAGKKFPIIPGPPERTLKLDYRLHVSGIPQDAQYAYAWIPMPRTTSSQELANFKVSGNWDYDIVKDTRYGNKYIRVDLLSNESKKSPNAQVMVKYDIRRVAWQPIAKTRERYDLNDYEKQLYLQPEKNTPIDKSIYDASKRIAGGESGFSIQAKLIFDNITATVKYSDSEVDFSHCDTIRTLDSRAGNSADCNSLFVDQMRSLSVPSRLVAGVTIPIGKSGEINVYGTWSEFFDPDLGWLPVDIVNAINQKDYRESYFGGLDSNRIEFSIGRDIILPGAKAGGIVNPFYPYVEINGKPHKDVKCSISYQEIPGKGAGKSKDK